MLPLSTSKTRRKITRDHFIAGKSELSELVSPSSSSTSIHYPLFLIRYHLLDLLNEYGPGKIKSYTTVILSPLPTCEKFKSCWECTTAKTAFSCRWCPRLRSCSDGLTIRKGREWIDSGCFQKPANHFHVAQCPVEIVREEREFYKVRALYQAIDSINSLHDQAEQLLASGGF